MGSLLVECIVINAIGCETSNRLFNLLEHGFYLLCIAHVILGSCDCFDLTFFWVRPLMKFAPGAPFGLSAGSHFPIAFTIYLQTGTIHDNVDVR